MRTPPLILLFVGAVLARLATGDALLRYVRPGARVLVLAAAGVLVAAAAAELLRPSRAPRRRHWAALAPALVIAVVAPPALGPGGVRAPVAPPPRPARGFAALGHADPTPIRLVDVVLRAFWGAGDSLRGRRLQVTGFVSATDRSGFVLTRFVISCCAADAQPYDLHVAWRLPPPTGSWVQVVGTYAGLSPHNRLVPRLAGSAVATVTAPANPYDQ